jgi:DNA modification methylase
LEWNLAEQRDSIHILYMPLSELSRAPRNPKRHDLPLIDRSFTRFGFIEPIAINETTGRIVAGHGRLDTLERKRDAGEPPPERIKVKDGEWHVPVLRGIHFENDAAAEAYLLASNQTTIAGGWQDEELAKVLADLAGEDGGLDGIGFDQEYLDDLLRRIGEDSGAVLQDEEDRLLERARELQQQWQTARGQIWQAGSHRIYCGDCREVPQGLFEGRIRLIWTDPPFGVNYAAKARDLNAYKGSKSTIELAIEGDDLDGPGVRALFAAALAIGAAHAEPGCVLYATVASGDRLPFFIQGMELAGFVFKHSLVWVKNALVLGRADYHYRHELILYGWRGDGVHRWAGGRGQTSVFQVDRPTNSDHHPTTKPVELVAQMIHNSTFRGDIVFDPFCGSGTTLVAGHQLGRVVYAVEQEPLYVAVQLERLAQLGLKPALRN